LIVRIDRRGAAWNAALLMDSQSPVRRIFFDLASFGNRGSPG
jgi:hypothetical protein